MSNVYDHTKTQTLKDLVNQVHKGENVLPEFQRSFVWDPRDIKSLLVSIVSKFPAGSILSIRRSRSNSELKNFAIRNFENAPKLHEKEAVNIILDGQQRLTSLHNALYGTGKHLFFIDVNKLRRGEEFEEAIFSLPRNQKNNKLLVDEKYQINELKLPISTFIIEEKTYEWIELASTTLAEIDHNKDTIVDKSHLEKKFRSELREKINPIKDALLGYQFPILTLDENSSIEAICKIFETLNNTGVRLSVFDLLNARFHPYDIFLRELWKQAKENYRNLDDYNIDPYQLLQCISAITSTTQSVSRKAVLNLDLDKTEFEEKWHSVCFSMSNVINMLRGECGVISHKWIPYSTILVTLATVVSEFPIDKGVDSGKHKDILKKWFWRSCFSKNYQQSPITQISQDIPKLKEWLKNGIEYLKFDAKDISEDEIRDITHSQRGVYRSMMCAIVSNGLQDFYTTTGTLTSMTSSDITARKFDDHHIFPKAFLRGKSIDNEKIDNISNRTIIDASTNRSIGENVPSKYLKEIKNVQGVSISEEVLRSHLIDYEALAAIWNNDFEAFSEIRFKLIKDRLKELLQ